MIFNLESNDALKNDLAIKKAYNENAIQIESIVTNYASISISYSKYSFNYCMDITVGAITLGTKTLLATIIPEDARPLLNSINVVTSYDGKTQATFYVQTDGTIHVRPHANITSARYIISN